MLFFSSKSLANVSSESNVNHTGTMNAISCHAVYVVKNAYVVNCAIG